MQTLNTVVSVLLCATGVSCSVPERLVAQSCPTRCDFMDRSPPGFSICGFPQARILKKGIIFSRGSSRPRDQTRISCFYCTDRQILYHCTTWEALELVDT